MRFGNATSMANIFTPAITGMLITIKGFKDFGHDVTGQDGSYRFRTIKPGKYPGRAPHIHVKVLDGNREVLTTQFYEDNPSENSKDGLYRRLSTAQADRVLMRYQMTDRGVETIVDIVV